MDSQDPDLKRPFASRDPEEGSGSPQLKIWSGSARVSMFWHLVVPPGILLAAQLLRPQFFFNFLRGGLQPFFLSAPKSSSLFQTPFCERGGKVNSVLDRTRKSERISENGGGQRRQRRILKCRGVWPQRADSLHHSKKIRKRRTSNSVRRSSSLDTYSNSRSLHEVGV